ncbi:predicted ABC-type nitrate/sulfonate/bicarbonate transport system, periplasmic component [Desulforapulum autotrophicum HRM2]|uniref:Predicted ABC-type nitrate/sulfonate/bicarbonate transport system, periplasmic component n=2 Tax=Desulforapulum autotrophicum TaxID=2296 RepID=C0QKV3_DESAH|nr:predicted ABC-type nitrate/sulfonate/bicarbonate transport system, periplasmic component [Desulforapulum autotrophicum HRM2]
MEKGGGMGEKPVFRIGLLKWVGDFSMGLAGSKGAFDPVPLGSWTQILDSLRDRRIDGAFIPVPAAIDLVTSGTDIRILLKGPNPGAFFIKNRGADIKSLADFKGKTVLVPHGLSIYTLLVHRLMASIGLRLGNDSSSDVVFEPMAVHLMAEALAYDDDGRIGGFIGPEPFGTMAVKAGAGRIVCRAERLWPGYPPDVFVLGGDLVESFPDAVSSLVETLGNVFFFPRQSGREASGMLNFDCLIDIKTVKQIEEYMGAAFGFVAGTTDFSRAVQMDFAMKTGAAI